MRSCVDDVSLKLVSEGKVVDRQGICTMPLNVVWSRIRFFVGATGEGSLVGDSLLAMLNMRGISEYPLGMLTWRRSTFFTFGHSIWCRFTCAELQITPNRCLGRSCSPHHNSDLSSSSRIETNTRAVFHDLPVVRLLWSGVVSAQSGLMILGGRRGSS